MTTTSARRAAERRWCGGLLGVLLLVATPSACSSSSAPAGRSPGAVLGTVVSAPSCPVERSDSPCPPRPVRGAVVDALAAGRIRASTHTDSSGRFRLALPFGSYLIRATNVGVLRTTAAHRVRVGRLPVSITLVVDSGIR